MVVRRKKKILMGRRKKPRMVNISAQENMEVQAHDNVPSHATNWVSSSCVNDQSSPDALLSEVALESETTNAEKRRGPTLMTHIWNQSTDKRIIVRWNKYWQPVGDEAPILANFLGTIARNPRLCCVKYVDWRFFPKKNRNELLDIVKSKFVIRHPLAEKYVLKSLGKKWSNYKGELKYDHYEPHFGNQTAILKDKPDHVSEDQWRWLVKYWNTPAAKERSEKNRKSRELQDMAHTGGTKSFARYADEKVVDGVLPSRASVYLDTHTKRKVANTPMDEKSKQAVDMIKEKLSELPNGIEETNGRAAWEGDVYSQVMNVVIGPERKNQVRGLGRAPKPFAITSRFEDKDFFDDDDHEVCTEKIESLKCQLKEMKDKLEQNEKENANVQSLLNEEIRMLKEVVFARRILEDCNI